jgi:hypothetical protein
MASYFEQVDPELLMTVNRLAKEEIERSGSVNLEVLVSVHFGDTHSAEELTSIICRLNALSKMLREEGAKKWTMSIAGREYKLAREAVLLAAAKAPLLKTKTVGEVAFKPDEFLKIALEDAKPEGSA